MSNRRIYLSTIYLVVVRSDWCSLPRPPETVTPISGGGLKEACLTCGRRSSYPRSEGRLVASLVCPRRVELGPSVPLPALRASLR